ncbi:MAG: hypothetical protein LAT61_03840 [Alcanivorax sp.]|nr:hypothetical protein [Alcanivorax sp.]
MNYLNAAIIALLLIMTSGHAYAGADDGHVIRIQGDAAQRLGRMVGVRESIENPSTSIDELVSCVHARDDLESASQRARANRQWLDDKHLELERAWSQYERSNSAVEQARWDYEGDCGRYGNKSQSYCNRKVRDVNRLIDDSNNQLTAYNREYDNFARRSVQQDALVDQALSQHRNYAQQCGGKEFSNADLQEVCNRFPTSPFCRENFSR